MPIDRTIKPRVRPLPQVSRPFFRIRLAWRLMLGLFVHLVLLLMLAIFLEQSLTEARRFTPGANALERLLVSATTAPALLDLLDLETKAYEKTGDPLDQARYYESRRALSEILQGSPDPALPPNLLEAQRQTLISRWLNEVGDRSIDAPQPPAEAATQRDAVSKNLLTQIQILSDRVQGQSIKFLRRLDEAEQTDSNDRVSRMWGMVELLTFFTILLQTLIANSIIAPIQALAAVVVRLRKGDYSARANLHSHDEVEDLGNAFNAMASDIQRNQNALQQANLGLAERVQAKTREIQTALTAAEDLRAELQDKNRELEEAVRLKNEFLAMISHELRTPLTPVISSAHLLAIDPKLDRDAIRSVQMIERNARALSRMIDELLDLSAGLHQKVHLEREQIEMNEWALAAVTNLQPEAARKQLSLRFVPAPEPFALSIDATRLAQVLTNLLTNAIKFTEPGGTITVTLSADEVEVCLRVCDSGSGLAPQELDRVFEMFYQVRDIRQRTQGGLGVGLTVARSLLELHGGRLEVASAGRGFGTTFSIRLPRVAPPLLPLELPPAVRSNERASQNLLPHLPVPFLRDRCVLIVEDSTDTRDVLGRILQRRGARVVIAGSAEEALAILREEAPEIILSDIGLPGLSGLEFMRQVRQLFPLRRIISVALSGLGREADVAAAREAGFDAHLLKPVGVAELDRVLQLEIARSVGPVY